MRESCENHPSDNAALFSDEFFVFILHFVAAWLSNISSCDAVKIRIENIWSKENHLEKWLNVLTYLLT